MVPAVVVRSAVTGRAAVVVPAPWRVMPGVVLVMRRRRVTVPRRVMPRMVMMVRRRRMRVPRRVVPGVVLVV